MNSKVSVYKTKRGPWVVEKINGDGPPVSTRFKSKAEAVSHAWAENPERNVVIHTATGQVISQPDIETTKPAAIMRQAVLDVVMSRTPRAAIAHAKK